jgi:hypothetical protein
LSLSYELSLRKVSLDSKGRSQKTIDAYFAAVAQLDAYVIANGFPTDEKAIKRRDLEGFIGSVRKRTSASTAATRYR